MGDLRGTPLLRLAGLLDIEGQPPEDFGWTEVIDGVRELVRMRDDLQATADLVMARTCCVYDHGLKAPCRQRIVVQNVCEAHATMCAMCGKRPSARGVCPTCLDELVAERAAGSAAPAPTSPPAKEVPTPAPDAPEPAAQPPRRKFLDSF